MFGQKKLPVLFAILCLPLLTFAQPIFTVDQSNVGATVNQIMNLYGGQIQIDQTDINAFLTNFVSGSTSGCPAPIPEVDMSDPVDISFTWPAVFNATAYLKRSLDLVDNTVNNLQLTLNDSSNPRSGNLVLHGFASICASGQKSKVNIIIVDEDVSLPPTSGDESCECENPQTIEIEFPGDGSDIRVVLEDQGCAEPMYVLNLQGPNYNASVTFSYGENPEGGINVMVPADCASPNMDLSPNSTFVGDISVFALSYQTNGFIIDIMNPTAITSGNIQYCACDGLGGEGVSGGGSGGNRKGEIIQIKIDKNPLEIFPNPSDEGIWVSTSIPDAEEYDLVFYDATGKKVLELKNNQKADSNSLLYINISNWPKGLYTCRLIHDQGHESSTIVKQ